jgi:uncharacterized protein (TIGR03067 family)
MNHIKARAIVCLSVFTLAWPGTSPADDDATAKELKRLEGVWASTPPKKGRGRGNVLVFQGGRMGWESFQTRDGEPVIGHAKLFDIRLDPTASPKQITATLGEGKERETREGIYELDGDTMKIAFGAGLKRGAAQEV